MTRIVVIALAAAFGLGVAALPARAHHSHPVFYNQCKTVTVEGRVERVNWKDPHSQIYVTLDDGTTFRAEWTSLRGLTNNGITGPALDALRVGARVVAMGNPPRDGAYVHGKFPELKDYEPDPKSIDLLLIRRADDTWSWKRHDPAECART
jgi:hypothetical protein